MNAVNESSSAAPLPNGEHLATISHDGRFWEVYLEFEDDPNVPTSYRGILCFSPQQAPERGRPGARPPS